MSQHELCIFLILYPFMKKGVPENNVSYYFPPPTACPDSGCLHLINNINMWIPGRLNRAITSTGEGLAALNQFSTANELNVFIREMGRFLRAWRNWDCALDEVVDAFKSYRAPAPVRFALKREGIFACDLKAEQRTIMDPQVQL